MPNLIKKTAAVPLVIKTQSPSQLDREKEKFHDSMSPLDTSRDPSTHLSCSVHIHRLVDFVLIRVELPILFTVTRVLSNLHVPLLSLNGGVWTMSSGRSLRVRNKVGSVLAHCTDSDDDDDERAWPNVFIFFIVVTYPQPTVSLASLLISLQTHTYIHTYEF